jgi:protein TonB
MSKAAASGATPALLLDPGSATSPTLLIFTLVVAAALHALLLLTVSFKLPDTQSAPRTVRPLEVVVLRTAAPTGKEPEEADAFAQVDREGSGTDGERNVTDSRPIAQSPEPSLMPPPAQAPEPLPEPTPLPEPAPGITQTPEPEPQLSATIEEATTTPPPLPKPELLPEPLPPPLRAVKPAVTAAQIMASRSLEIAKLTAKIEEETIAYASRPRRKAISASTREYKYASYLEAWRRKVEQVGNLNYPEEAKQQKLYGNLILHVALRSDGSLEDVRVLRSSGFDVLDQAAVRIVELAAPFSPFPPDIKAETDVLDITRTWQFLSNNRLGWEN